MPPQTHFIAHPPTIHSVVPTHAAQRPIPTGLPVPATTHTPAHAVILAGLTPHDAKQPLRQLPKPSLSCKAAAVQPQAVTSFASLAFIFRVSVRFRLRFTPLAFATPAVSALFVNAFGEFAAETWDAEKNRTTAPRISSDGFARLINFPEIICSSSSLRISVGREAGARSRTVLRARVPPRCSSKRIQLIRDQEEHCCRE